MNELIISEVHKPVKIGEFSSKAAMIAFCKLVLNSYQPGEVLRNTDLETVIEIVKRHPRAQEKIGCGIKEIIVRNDPVWKKTKQFWIIRTDGSGIDFSYKKCVNGEPASIDTFRAACRTAVANDIFKFKLAELQKNPTCPFRNIPLDLDNSHVEKWPRNVASGNRTSSGCQISGKEEAWTHYPIRLTRG